MKKKDITYYRKSKNDKWYRVHYEQVKVNDIIKYIDNFGNWCKFHCTSITIDGLRCGEFLDAMNRENRNRGINGK